MKKFEYVVKFKPKHKNSKYEPYVLSPYSNDVVWSKERAKKEMTFHKKSYHAGHEDAPTVRELYNARVVKRVIKK